MSQPAPRALVERLLRWYADHARELPWRAAPEPWSIWLSEVMAQQTRIETVKRYHGDFLARWPTVESFAAASEAEVLSAWSGLGYYSRARNLLTAARRVAAQGWPRTEAAWRALPGVGPYTAGAVSSIAFGERVPVVDGNVERVVCRVDRVLQDPRREGRRQVWRRVASLHEALAEDERPGDLNQALMELGALVCVPRVPRCGVCPLAEPCRGRGEAGALPVRAPKRPVREVVLEARVVTSPAGTWLVQRPGRGLYAGLWEPPLRPTEPRPGAQPLVHLLTHRRLVVYPVREAWGEPRPGDVPADYVGGAWLAPAEVPLSTLARRLLADRGTMEACPPSPS